MGLSSPGPCTQQVLSPRVSLSTPVGLLPLCFLELVKPSSSLLLGSLHQTALSCPRTAGFNPRSKPGTGRGKISSHFTNEEAGLPGGGDFGGLIEKGDSTLVPGGRLLGPSSRVRAVSGRRTLPSWDGG